MGHVPKVRSTGPPLACCNRLASEVRRPDRNLLLPYIEPKPERPVPSSVYLHAYLLSFQPLNSRDQKSDQEEQAWATTRQSLIVLWEGCQRPRRAADSLVISIYTC